MRRRVPVLVVVLSGIIVVGSILISGHPAAAAGTPISLTTSPISLDLDIKPGTSTTKTLQLMNNGSQPLPINMRLDEFSAHGNSGEAAITAPKANDPSASWVHFSPANFTAQPGVWTSVQMTIKLPSTAQLGYYYAVVFQPQLPNNPAQPHTTTIKGSNAVLILVDTQSGNESHQVQIGNFSVSKHIYQFLPATFSVSVHNTGNIYLAPSGDIFISRHSDGTNSIAALNVNSAGGNVLPKSVRNFQAKWDDGFPSFEPKTVAGQPVTDKMGQPIEQLQWNFTKLNKFRFGKYYAVLALVYNNGVEEIPLNAMVSFWVIPWELMLVAVVLITLLGFGFWSIGRALLRRIRGFRGIRRR